MTWRATLLLAAAAVLLTGVNLLDAARREAAHEARARRGRLVPLPAREIRAILLERPERPTVRLRREEGGWRLLAESITDVADASAVSEVLSLATFQAARRVPAAAAPAFDPRDAAVARLTLLGPEERVPILFGPEADGGGRYAWPEGEPDRLHLLDPAAGRFLTRSLDDWRARSLFQGPVPEAQALVLEGGPGGPVRLTRAAGGWRLEAPVRWPAEGERVATVLRRCAELNRREILAEKLDEPAAFGLGEGAVQVTLSLPGMAPQTVRLGPPLVAGDHGVAVAAGRPAVFGVSDALRRLVQTTPAEAYRRRRLKPLAGSGPLAEIIVETGGQILRLVRQGEQWFGRSPRTFSADAEVVKVLRLRVEHLAVERFVRETSTDLPAYGLAPPTAQVRFVDREGEEVAVLRLGKPAGEGEVYLSLEGRPGVFTVDRNFAELAVQPWFAYHQRQIALFELTGARRLEIHRDGTTYAYARTVGDAWQMVSPQTLPADAEALYLGPLSHRGLGDLRALSFVAAAPGDLSKFGLDRPRMRVVVEFALPGLRGPDGADHTLTRDIEIGTPVALGERQAYYARLRDEDLIFLLDGRVVAMLRKDYADREFFERRREGAGERQAGAMPDQETHIHGQEEEQEEGRQEDEQEGQQEGGEEVDQEVD